MKPNVKKSNSKSLCHLSPEELAYIAHAQQVLLVTVTQTVLGDGYYQQQPEATQAIIKAASRCEPLFIAKLAIFIRHRWHLKRASHLLAGILAPVISGHGWGKQFFYQVIKEPDDMTEILMIIDQQNRLQHKYRKSGKIKVPHALKAGFKKYLEQLVPAQIDQYKMKRRKFSLIDLINFFHPTPNAKNKEAFRRLKAGESLAGLYDPDRHSEMMPEERPPLDKFWSTDITDPVSYTKQLEEINSISIS